MLLFLLLVAMATTSIMNLEVIGSWFRILLKMTQITQTSFNRTNSQELALYKILKDLTPILF
jgi:hypothetical protein